jgi:membrane dipeptidase
MKQPGNYKMDKFGNFFQRSLKSSLVDKTAILRRFALIFLLTLSIVFNNYAQQLIAGEQITNQAKIIHEKALTIDTHVDIPENGYATETLDPGIDNPKLKCDLVKMNRGGIDGVFLAVYVGQTERNEQGYKNAFESAMAKFETIHRLTDKLYPDRCRLATSLEQFERIAGTGKKAIMIGIENGFAIGKDLSNIERFYKLGARYITLSHNGHNDICDSCNPRKKLGDETAEHHGLSEFGKKVVEEMNRLGMMVDVSHISKESFYDVIEVSKAPIIASHSGCAALADNPRNLDDEQLKQLAKNGGVIQIVALDSFLKPMSDQRRQAIDELEKQFDDGKIESSQMPEKIKEIDAKYPSSANVEVFVDHIEHAIQIAGIDHVGIGTDFDGGGGIPGFNDHSEALNVTIELLKRGHSEEEIFKIWGGNLLRVWREVEKVAQQLQKGTADERAGN